MLAAIPLMAWFLMFLFFSAGSRLRESFLWASLAWSLYLVLITEILSLFNAVTTLPLTVLWLIPSIVALILVMRGKRLCIGEWPGVSWMESLFLGALLFSVGILALIAFTIPITINDSLSYHMPRVIHWAEAGSVAPYTTHTTRQIFMPPFPGFVILQFQVLLGNDRLANLVQWFSMAGATIVASLIARSMGLKTKPQILTALLVVTLPMGICQAATVQTDYVTAFWFSAFVFCGLQVRARLSQGRWPWKHIAGFACSFALAAMSKGYVYLYGLPFAAWFLYGWIRKNSYRSLIPVIAVLAVFFTVNLGYISRNISVFRGMIPTSHGEVLPLNFAMTPRLFLSNALKHTSLHMAVPHPVINQVTAAAIKKAHDFLGVDIDATTVTYEKHLLHFRIHDKVFLEDVAGNALHLFLILISLVAFVMSKAMRKEIPIPYILSVSGGFLLYAWVVPWSPFMSMYHLSLFVLWSPVIACMLTRIFNQKVQLALGLGLWAASWPWLLFNPNRPVLAAENNIFSQSRSEYSVRRNPKIQCYYDAMNFLLDRDYRNIGIVQHESGWEYPFWTVIWERGENVRIEHVGVRNETAALSQPFNPDAVIVSGLFGKMVPADYLPQDMELTEFCHLQVLTKPKP